MNSLAEKEILMIKVGLRFNMYYKIRFKDLKQTITKTHLL